MKEHPYSIDVRYDFSTDERKEVSENVFRMLVGKGLNFKASPMRLGQGSPLQNIRVFINDGNVQTGYSPLVEMSRLETAVEGLARKLSSSQA